MATFGEQQAQIGTTENAGYLRYVLPRTINSAVHSEKKLVNFVYDSKSANLAFNTQPSNPSFGEQVPFPETPHRRKLTSPVQVSYRHAQTVPHSKDFPYPRR